NRGAALRAMRRYEESLKTYQTLFPDEDALAAAVDIVMMHKLPHVEDALLYARELYQRAPQRDNIPGIYHAICQALAYWDDYYARTRAITVAVNRLQRASTPFFFLYTADSPAAQLACARSHAHASSGEPLWRGETYAHERIRIGYLSSDLQAHATAYLAAGMFELHDRHRFECFAFSH